MTLGDNGRFGVARYRHRGQPDEDFGDGGVASANFTPFNDEGKALDFQPCGAAPDGASKTCIVMVGKAQPLEDGPGDVALVRFTPKGQPDPTFGVGSPFGEGLVVEDIGHNGANDEGNAIVVLPGGRILVAGQSDATPFVARFTPEGELDEGFGESGGYTFVPIDGATRSLAFSIALVDPDPDSDGDERMLVAGVTFDANGQSRMYVARLDAGGSPDEDFGDLGVRVIDDPGYDSQAVAVRAQRDGMVLVAGKATGTDCGKCKPVSWFAAARVTPEGEPDESFGPGGVVHLPPMNGLPGPQEDDGAYAMTIQRDGAIVLVGEAYNGADDDVVAMRLRATAP